MKEEKSKNKREVRHFFHHNPKGVLEKISIKILGEVRRTFDSNAPNKTVRETGPKLKIFGTKVLDIAVPETSKLVHDIENNNELCFWAPRIHFLPICYGICFFVLLISLLFKLRRCKPRNVSREDKVQMVSTPLVLNSSTRMRRIRSPSAKKGIDLYRQSCGIFTSMEEQTRLVNKEFALDEIYNDVGFEQKYFDQRNFNNSSPKTQQLVSSLIAKGSEKISPKRNLSEVSNGGTYKRNLAGSYDGATSEEWSGDSWDVDDDTTVRQDSADFQLLSRHSSSYFEDRIEDVLYELEERAMEDYQSLKAARFSSSGTFSGPGSAASGGSIQNAGWRTCGRFPRYYDRPEGTPPPQKDIYTPDGQSSFVPQSINTARRNTWIIGGRTHNISDIHQSSRQWMLKDGKWIRSSSGPTSSPPAGGPGAVGARIGTGTGPRSATRRSSLVPPASQTKSLPIWAWMTRRQTEQQQLEQRQKDKQEEQYAELLRRYHEMHSEDRDGARSRSATLEETRSSPGGSSSETESSSRSRSATADAVHKQQPNPNFADFYYYDSFPSSVSPNIPASSNPGGPKSPKSAAFATRTAPTSALASRKLEFNPMLLSSSKKAPPSPTRTGSCDTDVSESSFFDGDAADAVDFIPPATAALTSARTPLATKKSALRDKSPRGSMQRPSFTPGAQAALRATMIPPITAAAAGGALLSAAPAAVAAAAVVAPIASVAAAAAIAPAKAAPAESNRADAVTRVANFVPPVAPPTTVEGINAGAIFSASTIETSQLQNMSSTGSSSSQSRDNVVAALVAHENITVSTASSAEQIGIQPGGISKYAAVTTEAVQTPSSNPSCDSLKSLSSTSSHTSLSSTNLTGQFLGSLLSPEGTPQSIVGVFHITSTPSQGSPSAQLLPMTHSIPLVTATAVTGVPALSAATAASPLIAVLAPVSMRKEPVLVTKKPQPSARRGKRRTFASIVHA